MSILLVLVLSIVGAGAVQIRPANQINHPGLTNPYVPPVEGQNHMGVSDYTNKWLGISELCENDWQMRPANQGWNILRFLCCWGD